MPACSAWCNALMEEAAFRGVLQEALTAEWGPWWAVGLQGLLFGVIHAQGFPRGVVGMVMASAYGVALGMLRLRSGGMAASCGPRLRRRHDLRPVSF